MARQKTGRSQLMAQLAAELDALGASIKEFERVAARASDLHRTDYRLLNLLIRGGPMTAGHLGQALSLSSGATTAAIDRLERRGFLVREVHEPDRRIVTVRATDAAPRPVIGSAHQLLRDTPDHFDGYSKKQLGLVAEFLKDARALLAGQTGRLAGEGEGREEGPRIGE